MRSNDIIDYGPELFPIFVRQGKSRTRYKVGYINVLGEIVIPPRFDDGARFNEGLAAVAVKNRWGVLNTGGSLVVQPKLWNWCRFCDGLASVATREGKWGAIDREGKYVVSPNYDYIGPFEQGLALFRLGECSSSRFGFLNKKGAEVIPPTFHSASGFSEGLAAAKVGTLWGYIDASGVFKIWPRFEGTRPGRRRPQDTRAGYFVNGLAPVWLGKGYGTHETARK